LTQTVHTAAPAWQI